MQANQPQPSQQPQQASWFTKLREVMPGPFMTSLYVVSALVLTQAGCQALQGKTICGLDRDYGAELVIDELKKYHEAGIEMKIGIIDEIDRRTQALLRQEVKKRNCPDTLIDNFEGHRSSSVHIARETLIHGL